MGGTLRRRWEDKKHIYECNIQHGKIEKYNKRGDHLGEFDPVIELQTKLANPIKNIKKYI